jgi:hypothetical protein
MKYKKTIKIVLYRMLSMLLMAWAVLDIGSAMITNDEIIEESKDILNEECSESMCKENSGNFFLSFSILSELAVQTALLFEQKLSNRKKEVFYFLDMVLDACLILACLIHISISDSCNEHIKLKMQMLPECDEYKDHLSETVIRMEPSSSAIFILMLTQIKELIDKKLSGFIKARAVSKGKDEREVRKVSAVPSSL